MGSDTGPRIAGSVVVYRLYDVGYEIDLERAADLPTSTPQERADLRRTPRAVRVAAQTIQIKTPPITSPLGVDTVTLDMRRHAYAMLNAEAMAARNEVLEVAIIVLIVVEIVIAVVLGRR